MKIKNEWREGMEKKSITYHFLRLFAFIMLIILVITIFLKEMGMCICQSKSVPVIRSKSVPFIFQIIS